MYRLVKKYGSSAIIVLLSIIKKGTALVLPILLIWWSIFLTGLIFYLALIVLPTTFYEPIVELFSLRVIIATLAVLSVVLFITEQYCGLPWTEFFRDILTRIYSIAQYGYLQIFLVFLTARGLSDLSTDTYSGALDAFLVWAGVGTAVLFLIYLLRALPWIRVQKKLIQEKIGEVLRNLLVPPYDEELGWHFSSPSKSKDDEELIGYQPIHPSEIKERPILPAVSRMVGGIIFATGFALGEIYFLEQYQNRISSLQNAASNLVTQAEKFPAPSSSITIAESLLSMIAASLGLTTSDTLLILVFLFLPGLALGIATWNAAYIFEEFQYRFLKWCSLSFGEANSSVNQLLSLHLLHLIVVSTTLFFIMFSVKVSGLIVLILPFVPYALSREWEQIKDWFSQDAQFRFYLTTIILMLATLLLMASTSA